MAESRFDKYVRETLADGVKERRAAFEKTFDDERAKLEAKLAALKEIADEGVRATNAKIDAAARKWGWTIREGSDPVLRPGRCFENTAGDRFEEAHVQYEPGNWDRSVYATGKVREAQLALEAFDAAVEKAARRLVVCKVDLRMKTDAFDKMMAEAIAKLLRQEGENEMKKR